MGQYYRPVLKLEGQNAIVYNRNVDNSYTMAKLTEHSWWKNECMLAIGYKLYKKKGKIAWVGDYAEDKELKKLKMKMTVKQVWGIDGESLTSADYKSNYFTYDCKFICNHTTSEYMNLNKFYKHSLDKDNCCLCPLSLLTAIGNGRGGGDYYGVNQRFIGIWAWDTISIEDEAPKDYTEIAIIFKEEC